MEKNPTLKILVFLIFVFLLSTVANVYFIFNPSGYIHEFDPYSFWAWLVILTQMLIAVYLFLIALAANNKYAKIFWLYTTTFILFGIAKLFIENFGEINSLVSVYENLISLFVLFLLLLLYHKQNFNLLEGFEENLEFSRAARKATGVLFIAILILAIWMVF